MEEQLKTADYNFTTNALLWEITARLNMLPALQNSLHLHYFPYTTSKVWSIVRKLLNRKFYEPDGITNCSLKYCGVSSIEAQDCTIFLENVEIQNS